MIRLNSKRTPKPDGKKKKKNEDVIENEETVEETKNPYLRQKDKDETPEFVSNFKSSNLQGIAYNPEKKQMWIRFQDGSVYTYYNVPLRVYRDFWHASSKGSYFWEKIRRNYSIPYRRLTSSLLFIPISNMRLNACSRRSRYPLFLKAATHTINIYTKTNEAIQELLDILSNMKCEGFENPDDISISFEDNFIDIDIPDASFKILYDDGIYTLVMEEGLDSETIELEEDNFAVSAANYIFAFLAAEK